MKIPVFFLFIGFCLMHGFVQAQEQIVDTINNGRTITHRDERVDMLGKKMAAYNESLSEKIQMVPGYRLLLINSTDRNAVMQLRSTLLQQFPDQKIYMTFQAPYIKLRMGNYIEKEEADKMKKKLIDMKLISGNIYVVSERVEQKPLEKNATEEQ